MMTATQAPIVVSELNSELDSEFDELRDDMEELNDFTSLLMPAARKSAARRHGAMSNCPIGRRHRQQHNHQLNGHSTKFPVIDEDLLMLASRKQGDPPLGDGRATPPPNLCRLITNVSECRWKTSKTQIVPKERRPPKSIVPTRIATTAATVQPAVEVVMRKSEQIPKWMKKSNVTVADAMLKPAIGYGNCDIVALKRLSALSMISGVSSSYAGGAMDDSVNCDCTSLAFSAFRSDGGKLALKRKRTKLGAKKGASEEEEADDSYRKVSSAHSASAALLAPPDSPANDSGISSSASQTTSRSASLSENGQCRVDQGQSHNRKQSNCANCGRKMSLPPPPIAKSVGSGGETAAEAASRRRRAIRHLLGNMMRVVLEGGRAKGAKRRNECYYCRGGKGRLVDLKLLTAPKMQNDQNHSRDQQQHLPVINIIQTADEGRAEKQKTAQKVRREGKPIRKMKI